MGDEVSPSYFHSAAATAAAGVVVYQLTLISYSIINLNIENERRVCRSELKTNEKRYKENGHLCRLNGFKGSFSPSLGIITRLDQPVHVTFLVQTVFLALLLLRSFILVF